MHFHLGPIVEDGLKIAGGLLGGAVGNGIEAGVDGYNSFENFHHGNTLGGVVDGAEAIYHGATAIIDGACGNIL